MSGRQLSSRSQAGRKGKQPEPSQRGNTGVLIFFLIMFLLLSVVLLQERLSIGLSILLDIVLLLLVVCMIGIWLLRRKRERAAVKVDRRTRIADTRAPLPVAYAVTVADLLRLTPGEFEDFVGDLLEITGQCSDVRRIGGAGDQGADLVARDRFGRPFIVQCKRYAGRNVGAGEMRDFLGARGIYGADECMFVTTSKFTEAARANMAHIRQSVFLLDGTNLVRLVRENWEKLPARWRQSLMERRVHAD